MASNVFLPLLLLFLIFHLPSSQSKLTIDYYSKTCPDFEKIIQDTVYEKQMSVPTTAAGVLRLFFHDCVVGGCDASLLLSSTAFNVAERDQEVNKALPGDAFDVVARAKTKLELACPGIVSCSDILAEATRDLVTMVGGPYINIRLGRKDSMVSHAVDVDGHIALPNMTLTRIIELFAGKGLDVQEMVALTGAHTIGFSHCSEFADRIFHYSKNSPIDPSMNPSFAEGLRKLCQNYTSDPTIAAFNDPMSPGRFDNTYFVNLQNGVALLASDQAMAADPRTKPYVDLYARDQKAFFEAFRRAMEKVSVMHVLTGKKGEVRRRCDAPNSMNSQSH